MMMGARGGSFAAAATMISSKVLPCHASSSSVLEVRPVLQVVAVLGDLDPATAKTVAGVAGPALSAFGFLFILRIVMSWYPRLPVTEFPYVLAYAPTEPFLAVTRKLIPPLGGVDVTPVVWFGLVSFLNEILIKNKTEIYNEKEGSVTHSAGIPVKSFFMCLVAIAFLASKDSQR
ncbi:Protein COFACTOR ASSEMBLY OF COMPLEX C SUBUNIT B CCB3, chloroplastic [Dichanthelium oligosanthes]|uniref:Protein COFACTOR ASSEMBLY OF COMPLEX C SUBUNIT B CCB3, chloroplastic n=1 Tax=Dichanthelium oligosanthes TaxID=888268 RepID=A0A1E5UPM7_9POAL|nr:Protein COFACTOR ASSEMBLY OF COMPLEX C SUBUNIT B CCB3, chloroplastic [Dichanthelium oligosanthes]